MPPSTAIENKLHPVLLTLLAILMIVFTSNLFYFFFVLLPEDKINDIVRIFGEEISLSPDSRIVFLVMVSGAMGSSVHALTSFTKYAGQGRLGTTWVWWYVMRPFIGTALALIFYLAIRAGLFSTLATIEHVNLYGILTIAGLSGMFSKQATDKLSELFNNFFRTKDSETDYKNDSEP